MILLINIDSKFQNLALHKIATFYKKQGHKIVWDYPLAETKADKVFVSCVFTKNKKLAQEWEGRAVIGGSGYSLNYDLPEEIEKVKPKINLGFTSRGCIRKCKFCIVPEKEGKIKAVHDIYDIWDGKSKEITLLDNNILALPDHFFKIADQIKKEKLIVDFSQGLDIRLLTDEVAEILKSIRIKYDYKFAFDDPDVKPVIKEKIKILQKYKIRGMFYILVGFNSSFEEELSRVEYLVSEGQRPFIMKYENCNNDPRYIALARWCNSPYLGKGTIPFKQYLKYNKDSKPYRKYFDDILK